jgi:hypothetical protein
VFDVSRWASAACWKTVRRLYVAGSSGGVIGSLYDRLRRQTDYNKSGLLLDLLGRDIRRRYKVDRHPVVVAHPLLVGVLKGRERLFYQHGELVVPGEAQVRGAERVFVPTEEAAAAFRRNGYANDQVIVTGLCIEPGMVAQAQVSWEIRCRRLRDREPLTGVFISSGAEPKEHVRRLTIAALSVARSGGRIVAIARQHGRLERSLTAAFAAESLDLIHLHPSDPVPEKMPAGLLALHANRRQEEEHSVRLFPCFDYVVCPSHERSNWALGLGLPMFAVTPAIGSFSPLNLQLLVRSGVAQELGGRDEGVGFGTRVSGLMVDGTLQAMSRAGWERYDIHGFSTIATWLAEAYGTP